MTKLLSNFKTPEELIGYCMIHSETERHLFNGAQLIDLINLSGDGNAARIDPKRWYSPEESDVKAACKKARERLKKSIDISDWGKK